MGSRSRAAARNFAGLALASALCVPAAALAAQFDYFIKLPPIDGETSDDKHKGEIEILSYSWGATQTSHGTGAGGMGAGKVSMQDISAPSMTSGPASKDMVLKGSKIGDNSPAAGGGVQVAAGDVTGDSSPAASGLPTGKRQHKPLMLTAPLARGSVTVRGKFPSCTVGTRYPILELGARAARYKLHDAVVTACGGSDGGAQPMEEISFNYAKIE